MKPLLNVTDLSSYLYCPRQFYLQKIKGLRQPPTQPMIEGSIRHQILETFGNNEEKLFENLELINHTPTSDKIKQHYQEFLAKIIKHIFEKNTRPIKAFQINIQDLYKKIKKQMNREIALRIPAIENTLKKGFTGKALWENLSPKYLSEYSLISENLGLKGRADRLMIADQTILPFELKTREADKIYPSDEIQLTAYAMLLEEKFNTTIPIAILETGNTKHELTITREHKQKVQDLIEEVNQLLETGKPKFPSNFSKCQNCFFEEACNHLEEEK